MSIGDRFPTVLSAASEGAEWAWAELYEEFAPSLLRFIASQGATDPEDCLGECFVQLVRNLPAFGGDEASFRAWLFLLARNRVVDEWRAARRRPASPHGEITAVDGHHRQIEAADAPLARQDAIQEILAALNPDQRAVLVLRVLDGFSVQETADILGRSAGAIRVLQHRAIRNLRATLSVTST
ncbi:MAG: sigma-70 family RNA polymerase sigma factor [Propionicimonas sp.]|nr:sigma-70 family RNA polymerase sigma factor [Propionicimonas sp.]